VVNTPSVTWPRDPSRIESTLLPLTAYRPLGLDVRFGCDTARLADGARGTDGSTGVVLATAVPGSGQAGTNALVVTVDAGRLRVQARGATVLDELVPPGACTYRITGRDSGLPVDVRGSPVPVSGPGIPIERTPARPGTVAGPTSAELQVSRDGAAVGRWQGLRLPDVDALVSDLTAVPPGALAVTLNVDDEVGTAPAPLKRALTVLLVVALVATAALLLLADRTLPRRSPRWPRLPGWAVLVDLVVVAVLAVWTIVAPATDDDGYFSVQARNATASGGIGDYFSFWNRSFTPFTWPYDALAQWQQWAGTAPVVQRVPALACGLLTWLAVRHLVRPAAVVPVLARAAAAVAFLAWWLPYDMGVRPEAVVAVCGAAAVAVLEAVRRRRLVVAWLAMVFAGAGAVAHPGGVVLLGVLVAGLPGLWALLREPAGGGPRDLLATVSRAAAVGSGLVVALLLGFADGALRDVLRGQAAIESVLSPDSWPDEVMRYTFLLDPVPQGNFAKRAAVLVCLVALAWFVVLVVAARARRVPVPAPLMLTGVATAVGFAALSLTPSKWTHHFGALAGIGSAFLGLLLVTAVPLTRAVLAGDRLPRAVPVALTATVAAVCALAWHGPNSWAYGWLAGVASAYVRPAVAGVTLDGPLLWVVLVGVVGLGFAVVAARSSADGSRLRALDLRSGVLRAAPLVVAVSLAGTVAWTVGTFAVAGVRQTPPGSLWSLGVADPAGTACGAARVVRVLDPAAPPLAAISAPGPLTGFVEGGGYFPGDRPPAGPVWGSLAGDGVVGQAVTAWYALPDPAGDLSTTVLAAGSFGDGITLTAVYGRRAGADVAMVGRTTLGDGATSSHWRTLRLEPPAGADAVRIEAVDATVAQHGWVAFTAPAGARTITLQQLLPPGAPVALGWQVAFSYPCQRIPAVVDGITEPATYAVLRTGTASAPPLSGLDDIAWAADRGGVFAAVPRSQSVLALATAGPVDPYMQVFAFRSPLERAAYTLVPGGRVVGGADARLAGGGDVIADDGVPPR
jgi:hypothetical protein